MRGSSIGPSSVQCTCVELSPLERLVTKASCCGYGWGSALTLLCYRKIKQQNLKSSGIHSNKCASYLYSHTNTHTPHTPCTHHTHTLHTHTHHTPHHAHTHTHTHTTPRTHHTPHTTHTTHTPHTTHTTPHHAHTTHHTPLPQPPWSTIKRSRVSSLKKNVYLMRSVSQQQEKLMT